MSIEAIRQRDIDREATVRGLVLELSRTLPRFYSRDVWKLWGRRTREQGDPGMTKARGFVYIQGLLRKMEREGSLTSELASVTAHGDLGGLSRRYYRGGR